MHTMHRSAIRWLALLFCSLAAAGTAQATTSELLAVNFGYTLSTAPGSDATAVLTVDYVENKTDPPRITGELYLELWAFPQPFVGLAQAGYQQNGYKLASYSLGRISPGFALFDVNSGSVPYAAPPPGTWYVTSLITEYDAGATNAGGWLPRAFFNYANPLVVTPPPSTAPPVAGLWWDPTQVGTGYTINVRHGVAVVTVYAYQPDGTAQWYLATGPLTNNGQTFTANLETFVGGPCIPCADPRYPTAAGNAGSISIVFASPTSATVYLPGGRVAHIVPADF